MAGRLIAITLAMLLAGSAARAGDIENLARQAETRLEAGEHAEAIADLRQALYTAMDASPLQFQRAHFVARKAAGYGMFNQRASNVFKPGEKLYVYAEPYGFGWQEDGNVFRSDMSADFALRTPQGKVLAGQKDFGRFKLDSYHRYTEYYLTLSYSLNGLKPGQYVIATTLRDRISGKSATFDLPFEVARAQ